MRPGHLTFGLLAFVVVGCSSSLIAQSEQGVSTSSGTVSVSDIAVSADTIGIGDLVDLTFTVSLASGTLAFLPDSLEAADFESFGPVEWTRSERDDGGTDLSVTYPLIAFQVGGVEVPEFSIFAARTVEAVRAGYASSGDVVGTWAGFREEPSAVSSASLITIPSRRLWVTSVLLLEDATNGIAPRPPADIVGGERHWPSILLLFGFSALLLWVLGTTTQAWMARVRVMNLPVPDPRGSALAALDELLAEGTHHAGEVRGFYERSSEIVRRYVEGFDKAWSPSWTSTELMSDLEVAAEHRAVDRLPGVDDLSVEMHAAEAVKFGGDRPGAERAEIHWRTIRGWVAEAAPPPSEDASA